MPQKLQFGLLEKSEKCNISRIVLFCLAFYTQTMKRTVIMGLVILVVLFVPRIKQGSQPNAQESEQFKIEDTVILQDINEPAVEGVPMHADQRRNTRLSRDGFSALLGETPLRVSIGKTHLDFKDSPIGVGKEAETDVKIMYTNEGGYTLYSGLRAGGYTNAVFNATGCSGGTNKCFTTEAKPWLDSGVFGFGYNLQGMGAEPDFIDRTYFRPFGILTTQDPSGVLGARGQAKEAILKLKVRLNQARAEQGTFTQNAVITVLHDW